MGNGIQWLDNIFFVANVTVISLGCKVHDIHHNILSISVDCHNRKIIQ